MLSTRRRSLHTQTITHITERAYRYHHLPPHPSELAAADLELKRGIDEDWKASVQRYPEVLEYFYGLVDLSLPAEDEPRVSDPPLSALGGGKGRVRVRSVGARKREGRDSGRERERERDRDRDRGERGGGGRRGVAFAPMPDFNYVQAPRY